MQPQRHKIPPAALVAALFVLCTVVYGLLCSYPRELAIYSDELRYLDIARSLLAGNGLVVRGLPSDYQKIFYPLCLLPALFCKTTAAQVTAIGWLNAGYMASAVFPVYLLCRRTGQGRAGTAFLLGVTATLPTFAAAATFMSETVFLPMSLWQVYFMVRCMDAAAPAARAGWCAVAGVWCYLLYLNKEVALYYLMAYGLTRAWWLWHHRAAWRGEVASWAALAAAFGGCFVLAKLTLFAGLGNSYNQTGALTPEQWRYMPFALVCNALFFVLAFGVVPVLLPLCTLRRPVAAGSRAERDAQLPLFLLFSLFIGVAAVAYTITVREDLGLASPRIHTRYVEPLLLPLLMVTLNALATPLAAARRRLLAALTALWAVGFVLLCRTIGPGAGDNTFLQWYDFVTDRLDRLPVLPAAAWGALWRLAVAAAVALLAATVLRCVPRTQAGGTAVRGRALPALACGTLVLCVLCNAGEQRINRWGYGITRQQATAASVLNDTLKTLDGKVLFVAAAVRGRDSQLVDTYLDAPFYLAEYTQLADAGLLADGVLDLGTEPVTPEYPGHPYTDLHEADYLLVADGVPIDTANLTPVNAVTPEGYTLYRNEEPGKVYFTV